jgi:hypothetical protein
MNAIPAAVTRKKLSQVDHPIGQGKVDLQLERLIGDYRLLDFFRKMRRPFIPRNRRQE